MLIRVLGPHVAPRSDGLLMQPSNVYDPVEANLCVYIHRAWAINTRWANGVRSTFDWASPRNDGILSCKSCQHPGAYSCGPITPVGIRSSSCLVTINRWFVNPVKLNASSNRQFTECIHVMLYIMPHTYCVTDINIKIEFIQQDEKIRFFYPT